MGQSVENEHGEVEVTSEAVNEIETSTEAEMSDEPPTAEPKQSKKRKSQKG